MLESYHYNDSYDDMDGYKRDRDHHDDGSNDDDDDDHDDDDQNDDNDDDDDDTDDDDGIYDVHSFIHKSSIHIYIHTNKHFAIHINIHTWIVSLQD